jgi:hypothetical protein
VKPLEDAAAALPHLQGAHAGAFISPTLFISHRFFNPAWQEAGLAGMNLK